LHGFSAVGGLLRVSAVEATEEFSEFRIFLTLAYCSESGIDFFLSEV